jgi:hypothetical protein
VPNNKNFDHKDDEVYLVVARIKRSECSGKLSSFMRILNQAFLLGGTTLVLSLMLLLCLQSRGTSKCLFIHCDWGMALG